MPAIMTMGFVVFFDLPLQAVQLECALEPAYRTMPYYIDTQSFINHIPGVPIDIIKTSIHKAIRMWRLRSGTDVNFYYNGEDEEINQVAGTQIPRLILV